MLLVKHVFYSTPSCFFNAFADIIEKMLSEAMLNLVIFKGEGGMINKLAPIASLGGRQINPGQLGERSPLVPQLETGKILSATVVESRGKDVFLLETAGTKFSVQSGVPLNKGEQIRFQVVSTNPVLELQKVENPLPTQMRRTLPLIGEPVNLSSLLRNLQTTFFLVLNQALDNQLCREMLRCHFWNKVV